MLENKFLLLFNTIRYLKPEQILGRASYLAKKYLQKCGFNPVKKILTSVTWKPLKRKTPFLTYKRFNNEDIIKRRFTFLNETVEFGESIGWRASGKGRLWRYNLHYFDYLRSGEGLPVDTVITLIQGWTTGNPPGTADAWDPFPISLRSVNWMKYMSETDIPEKEAYDIAGTLYEQILWLEKNLEHHLLANHFFKNIKALIFAGLFFGGNDSNRWLNKGLVFAERELSEQILPDGGHYERSPMYHSMIFEDCLDLLNVCIQYPDTGSQRLAERLCDVTGRMATYLVGMTHPDGEIALFNDAAFSIEAKPAELVGYYEFITSEKAPQSDGNVWSFPQSGYFIMAPDPGARLMVDCGPVGPDYQPGHSHCDTLSFEFSLRGKRVIVDSGCYGYEDGEIRQYNRGNMGHNTLTIDGENQSEVWGAHRCARRAYPMYARLRSEPGGKAVFEGAHDGYRRLSGKPIHYRRVEWSDGTISIDDRLDGKGKHDIELRLHINPELRVEPNGETANISDTDGQLATISPKAGRIEEAKGWYCPEFGLKKECTVLFINHKHVTLPYETGWRIDVAK